MGNAFTRDPATDNTNYGDPYTGGGAYTPGRNSGSGGTADDWFDQNAPPPPGANAANQKLWDDSGHDPAKFAAAFIAANHLQADQMNHAVLQQIVDAGNSVQPGLWAMDQADPQGRLEGIIHNGTHMQLIGGNGWTPMAPWPTEGGGGFSLGNFSMGQFATPWSGSFPTFTKAPAFVAPSGDEVLNDPGYKFRLGEGEKALQQSAAARGLLNTGGTAKDLIGYGQSLASNEYANVYNRRANEYATNYGTQTVDPYQNAYRNAMDSYTAWRNQQNDVWGRIVQAGTA